MVYFNPFSRKLPTPLTRNLIYLAIVMDPVPEQIHFERTRGSFNRSSSRFKGPPSPAVDLAWDEMTECMFLHHIMGRTNHPNQTEL